MDTPRITGSDASDDSAPQSIVSRLFSEFVAAAERGTPIDIAELCRANPEHADELRARYDAWCVIQRAVGPGGESIRITGASTTDSAWKAFLAQLDSRGPAHSRYVFQGELARGGMGVIQRVFDQDAQRMLAMKVVLGSEEGARTGNTPAIDDRSLGRFLEEAQVTSQLDHPGIVPVHEIGVDAAKNVYFTMKLVKGEDLRFVIDRVHDARDDEWTLPRAIGVIQRVCEAMAYAHAKGVIHRDLKPGNVMVGRFGEVYVMDWGLARVRGRKDERDIRIRPVETDSLQSERRKSAGETPDQALLTMDGQVLGTPAYMPPEQAEGKIDEVDEQSDVYAIGAILYHLIAGEMPFVKKGTQASNRTILARVLDGPPRPLFELAPRTPAELVAIVDRAMARTKSGRYASMAELGDDLRAYLEHRVVQAYQTGAIAEARKWVERNRALAAALAAAVLLLVAGFWTSLVFKADAEESARLAEERRGQAETARAQAQADKEAADKSAEETKIVAEFQSRMLSELSVDEFGHAIMVALRNDLAENLKRLGKSEEEIASAQAKVSELLLPGNPTNVAQRVLEAAIFEPAVRAIEREYADQPLIAAALQTPLAGSLLNVGLLELSERAARAAVSTQRNSTVNAKPTDLVRSMNALASVQQMRGEWDKAEAMLRDSLAMARTHLVPLDFNIVFATYELAKVLYRRGEYIQAEQLLGEVTFPLRGSSSLERSLAANAMLHLSEAIRAQGRSAEAETILRELLIRAQTDQPQDEHIILAVNSALAELLLDQGNSEQAETAYREVLTRRRAIHGDDHFATIKSTIDLAYVLLDRGRFADCESMALEALARSRARLGNDHPTTIRCLRTLADALRSQDKLDEAAPLYQEMISVLRVKWGIEHPSTLACISAYGIVLRALGKYAEAETLYREALAGSRERLGDNHPQTLSVINNLAILLQARGVIREAEELYRLAIDGRRRVLGTSHPHTLGSIRDLASFLTSQGRIAEAEPLAGEAAEGLRTSLGPQHPDTLVAINVLGAVMMAQGKFAEAEPLIRESLDARRRSLGENHVSTLNSMSNLATLLQRQGRFLEAEAIARELLERRRATYGSDHPSTLLSMRNLARILHSQRKLEDAEVLDREALDRSRSRLGANHPETLDAVSNLATLLRDLGRLSEACALFRESLAGRRSVLGDDHLDTLTSVTDLANLLNAQENYEEAESLFREALAGRRAKLGDEHSDTQSTIRSLLSLYEKWHAVDPTVGHNGQAVELRKLLKDSKP